MSDFIRCRTCGNRSGEHKRGTDQNGPANICPPGRGWGNMAAFPKWPKMRDEAKASALFDKRIAAYWKAGAKRGTFRPVT
jgi:hypothetical protein